MVTVMWRAFRAAVCVALVALVFAGELRWVLLPGRFLLELLGAHGPQAGRWAVFLSGIAYATVSLVASQARRRRPEPEGPLALDLT